MTVNWTELATRISEFDSFVLVSHIRPDCDALGSELGMAGVLRAMGKKVQIINGHPTPPNLAFIDPENEILVVGETIQADQIETDCIIVLDTSAWAQIGPMGDVIKAFEGPKLVIDHHQGEDDLGAEFFKDTTAEATGHLVAKFAQHVGIALDKKMASALYAAIATDTGWFRFGSTTSETYRVIASLVDAGASPSAIYAELYERDTIGRVCLRGRILSRTIAEADGQLVHTYVRKADFEETGAIPSDTEDAINLTLGIEGTQVAVILVEQLSGGFKLSFRSRCHVDCSQLAAQFGGGGHRAAAGAFIEGELEEAQPKVVQAALAALEAK